MYVVRVLMMAELTRYGIIGVVAMLLGAGGAIVLQPGELDHAYVCTTTQDVGIFDHLSSTSRTGYPFSDTNSGSKLCADSGVWQKCTDWAAAHGTTCQEAVANAPETSSPSGQVVRKIADCHQPPPYGDGQCVKATCYAD